MEGELRHLLDIANDLVSSKQSTCAAKGFLSLLRLRSEHKALAHSTEELKEETAKAKNSLEQADLALQNLLYEKQYYEKEIRSCRGFHSAFPDATIALQPLDEFLATAADDLKVNAGECSEHDLMQKRLAHERLLRIKMCRDLEELKQSKSSLLHQVSEQEKVLKQLQGNLRSLDETARPLHAVLSGAPILKGNLARNADTLLPVALFVLYSQMSAAKVALDLPINVSIIGQVEEAAALAEQLAAEVLEAGAAGGAVEPKKKKPRPGQSLDDTYKAHPLSIEVEIRSEPNTSGPGRSSPHQPPLTVRFQYLINLRIVTACCDNTSDNLLLSALFPFDDGNEMPSEALSQLEAGTFQFDWSRAAKPYRWCQHLAGIDIIPSMPLLSSQLQDSDQVIFKEGLSVYRRQQRVVLVVSRLQAVKEAHAALNSLLGTLVKSPLPTNRTKYIMNPITTVAAWELISRGGGYLGDQKGAMIGGGNQSGSVVLARKRKEPPAMGAGSAPPSGQATPLPAGMVEHLDEDVAVGGVRANVGVMNEDHLNSGLDEGEIPGSPLAPLTIPTQDLNGMTSLDYLTQQIFTPGPQIEMPDFMAFQEQTHEPRSFQSDATTRGSRGPPKWTYRLVLRYRQQFEVEVHVSLFLEYPTRPPQLMVQSVRELLTKETGNVSLKGSSAVAPYQVLAAVNDQIAMEFEANVSALKAVPSGSSHETLLYQLLHLRLSVDDFAARYIAETGRASKLSPPDLASQLSSRQRLRGRDRRPPPALIQEPC